jgi:hypothetical protein
MKMEWNGMEYAMTGNSYSIVSGKMNALFHEHTYNSVATYDYYISSVILNGKVMNEAVLNISQGLSSKMV